MRKLIFISIFFALLESFLGTFSTAPQITTSYETNSVTTKDGKEKEKEKEKEEKEETGDDDVDDDNGTTSRRN